MKLSEVIDQLVHERDINRSTLTGIVIEGMRAAYEKKYPEIEFVVEHDKASDTISILSRKEVIADGVETDLYIPLKRARSINNAAEVGSLVLVPFTKPIGRIEILKAKQVIAQLIRSIESQGVYDLFKDKQGSILNGTVYRCERSGAMVKIGDTLAFLPRSLMIPGEQCSAGFPIRALLKEVLAEPRSESQLVLDRVSPEFLQCLFELEIPEVFEKLVEVKKVVRVAGYKSKVVVASVDDNIDPVGTCVGVGGSRIKPILRELGEEKIDIIAYSDTPETFIASCLKPAQVEKVVIRDNKAYVWVDEDQRAYAIGKQGQNIQLAAQLSGYEIHLVKPGESVDMGFDSIFDDKE